MKLLVLAAILLVLVGVPLAVFVGSLLKWGKKAVKFWAIAAVASFLLFGLASAVVLLPLVFSKMSFFVPDEETIENLEGLQRDLQDAEEAARDIREARDRLRASRSRDRAR